MERGNEASGGDEPTGGEQSGLSGTPEQTPGDPGPTAGGGGPSSVAGGGENSGAPGDDVDIDLDMLDFDQLEFLEDGSMKVPQVDDDGNFVRWVQAETISADELANTPVAPGNTRLFDLGGRRAQMGDDGKVVFLD